MAIDQISQGNDFEIRYLNRGFGSGPEVTVLKVDGSSNGKVTVGSLAGGAAHPGKTDFSEGLTFTMTSGAAITAGRAVSTDSSGNAIHAVVTTAATPVVGIALNGASAAGQPVVVCWHGPARGVLSAATPPTRFYLTGTAGQLGTTKPATTGNTITQVGLAINATDLFVNISDNGTTSP